MDKDHLSDFRWCNLKPRGSVFKDIGTGALFAILKGLWTSSTASSVLELIFSGTTEDKMRLMGRLVLFSETMFLAV